MALLENWAKDLIVDETDGIPRFNVVQRNGAVNINDIYLKLSSAVLQSPTLLNAQILNLLFYQDDTTSEIIPKTNWKEW